MLYVLILYCTGWCPKDLPSPSGGMFYTSRADCIEALQQTEFMTDEPSYAKDKDGKYRLVKDVKLRQACVRMFAEPKQIDRLIDSRQWADFLKRGQ